MFMRSVCILITEMRFDCDILLAAHHGANGSSLCVDT